jgi:DNA modification methylase
MSCGWGGRLIGFLTSDCKKYIGTEPSTKTFDGLERLNADINSIGKEVELYKLGSEVFKPENESIDLCFTSPPYFDTEKYADEETQSYKKYPTERGWIDGFLKDTISNCYCSLKVGGKLMLNIANTKKYKTIENETMRISSEIGFKHVDTIYLILSSVSGNGEKLEPIFIFEK